VPLYRRAVAILEMTLGADDPKVADLLNIFANAQHALGETAEAEKLYLRSIIIWDAKKVINSKGTPTWSSAISEDGRFIISGSADNTRRQWQMPR
jgi:hypothetical protein